MRRNPHPSPVTQIAVSQCHLGHAGPSARLQLALRLVMARSDSAAQTAHQLLESLGILSDATIAGQLDALRLASSKLQAGVRRLEASNEELKTWLEADPEDGDLVTALEENREILRRKQRADDTIAELIERLRAEALDVADETVAGAETRSSAQPKRMDAATTEDTSWPRLPPSFEREPPALTPFQREVAAANAASGVGSTSSWIPVPTTTTASTPTAATSAAPAAAAPSESARPASGLSVVKTPSSHQPATEVFL